MSTQQEKAQTLAQLHAAPEILRVVNVWDVVSARTIAALPETKAIVTAGHSIAATFGYADGEKIPLEVMLDMVGRIVEVRRRPAGLGRPRRRIRQRGRDGPTRDRRGCRRRERRGPAAVRSPNRSPPSRRSSPRGRRRACRSSLNARTDAFIRGGDRAGRRIHRRRDQRGRAYLDAGADLVFVPGLLNADIARQLVEGIGERKVSVIGVPGALTAAEYEALGVARISYGPMTQRVALTALQDVASDLYADGVIPSTTRNLN